MIPVGDSRSYRFIGHHYPGLKADLLHPAYRAEDDPRRDGLACLRDFLAGC
jgi:hypothetical protein